MSLKCASFRYTRHERAGLVQLQLDTATMRSETSLLTSWVRYVTVLVRSLAYKKSLKSSWHTGQQTKMVQDWTLWQSLCGSDRQCAFFDVRVFNSFVQSYCKTPLAQCYRWNELKWLWSKHNTWNDLLSAMQSNSKVFSALNWETIYYQLWVLHSMLVWNSEERNTTLRSCIPFYTLHLPPIENKASLLAIYIGKY